MFSWLKKKKDEYTTKAREYFKPTQDVRVRDVAREAYQTVTKPTKPQEYVQKTIVPKIKNAYTQAKAKESRYYAPTKKVRKRDFFRELKPSNLSKNLFSQAKKTPTYVNKAKNFLLEDYTRSGFSNPQIKQYRKENPRITVELQGGKPNITFNKERGLPSWKDATKFATQQAINITEMLGSIDTYSLQKRIDSAKKRGDFETVAKLEQQMQASQGALGQVRDNEVSKWSEPKTLAEASRMRDVDIAGFLPMGTTRSLEKIARGISPAIVIKDAKKMGIDIPQHVAERVAKETDEIKATKILSDEIMGKTRKQTSLQSVVTAKGQERTAVRKGLLQESVMLENKIANAKKLITESRSITDSDRYTAAFNRYTEELQGLEDIIKDVKSGKIGDEVLRDFRQDLLDKGIDTGVKVDTTGIPKSLDDILAQDTAPYNLPDVKAKPASVKTDGLPQAQQDIIKSLEQAKKEGIDVPLDAPQRPKTVDELLKVRATTGEAGQAPVKRVIEPVSKANELDTILTADARKFKTVGKFANKHAKSGKSRAELENIWNKTNKKQPTEAMGAVAGVQEDEDGEMGYNWKTGLAGMFGLGVAKKTKGITKKAPKVLDDVIKGVKKGQKVDDVIQTKPSRKLSPKEDKLASLSQKKTSTQTPPVSSSLDISPSEPGLKNQPYKKVTNNGDSITQKQRKSTKDLIVSQGGKIKDADIRKFREEQLLGQEAVDDIILRKRGIITDEEAVRRASKLQVTIDDVVNAPKGKTYNKEELTAVSQVVQEQRESVKGLQELLAKQLDEGKAMEKTGKINTEGSLLADAVEQSVLKLKKAEYALMAAKSEAGRSLQGAKQSIEAIDSRMRIVYGHLKKQTPIERQATLEQIAKFPIEDDKNFIKLLEDLNTSDGFDKFAEWATAIKLYAPTTHTVNFGSNTLRQIMDMGITGLTNPKTIKADLQGAKAGLQSGLKNALKALGDEGYASTLSKYIEQGGQAPAIKGTKGKVIRSSFRALGAGDEIFRGMAHERSIYRQAQSIAKGNKKKMQELIERPTFDMMDEAKKQADRMTFQEEMGEITSKFNEFRTPARYKSKGGKTVGLVARLFVPFLKTPTNLFKQAADFSPIGLIKNRKALAKGFKEGAKQAEKEHAKRLLGEAVVGTAFIAYAAGLVEDGRITGAVPKDKKERDQFYAEGKLPYSIKIGDKWWQYNRVDPLSTVIGLTADIVKSDGDADEMFNIVANNLSDKTYTKGMGDLLKLMDGENWERQGILQSQFVGAFIPGLSGGVARSVDPVIRETKGEKKILNIPFTKGLKEKVTSQIPGASKTLPAKRDIVGQEIDRQKDKKTWLGKFVNQFLNPIKTSKETTNKTINELKDLEHTLSAPSDSMTVHGKEYKMNTKEYEKYSAEIGARLNKEVTELIATPKYQKMGSEDKIDAIDKVRKDITKDVKDDFVQGNKEKIADPYYELTKTMQKSTPQQRQNIMESMSESEQKKYTAYLKKEQTQKFEDRYETMQKQTPQQRTATMNKLSPQEQTQFIEYMAKEKKDAVTEKYDIGRSKYTDARDVKYKQTEAQLRASGKFDGMSKEDVDKGLRKMKTAMYYEEVHQDILANQAKLSPQDFDEYMKALKTRKILSSGLQKYINSK